MASTTGKRNSKNVVTRNIAITEASVLSKFKGIADGVRLGAIQQSKTTESRINVDEILKKIREREQREEDKKVSNTEPQTKKTEKYIDKQLDKFLEKEVAKEKEEAKEKAVRKQEFTTKKTNLNPNAKEFTTKKTNLNPNAKELEK